VVRWSGAYIYIKQFVQELLRHSVRYLRTLVYQRLELALVGNECDDSPPLFIDCGIHVTICPVFVFNMRWSMQRTNLIELETRYEGKSGDF
jgi:hypothetical protein